MALLLTDENFPMPAVMALRQLGHDVQTLLDTGQAGLAVPDDTVLAIATAGHRCLLTLNRKDFVKLHQQRPNHAGILICKADTDVNALAQRVNDCLSANQEQSGRLLRVQRTNL